MNNTEQTPRRATPAYFDLFQIMFEATDMMSAFWQPVLKGIGRSSLELASFNARQGQALVQWSRAVALPKSPADLLAANTQLIQTISAQYAEFAPRMAAAVNQATQPNGSFQVVPLPVRQPRDTLVILERDDEPELPFERKVA